LQVALNSDIWFPRVPGLLEKKSWITKNYLNHSLYCPIVEYRKGFDNQPLANKHTPRLNRFITSVAQAVAKMGGEWLSQEYELDEEELAFGECKELLMSDGIKLNI
jgi:hypothetical protein